MATELITDADRQHLHRWPIQLVIERLHHRRSQPGHHGPDDRQRLRHLPGYHARELPALPQRPRPPGSAQPVGQPDHALPGVAIGVVTCRAPAWRATPVDPSNNNIYYWAVQDNAKDFTRLHAEHHHRQPPGARGALGLQGRPALLLRAAAVHLQRRYAQGRRELPGGAGAQHHRRFPVRPRHRELHVGAVLRPRHRGSARHLRPGAARSRQSAARAVDPAAHQRGAAQRAGPALRGQRLQPEGAHARDRQLRHLPAFQPLHRPVERRLGAVLRAQVRAPAVVRGGARRGGAIERHHALATA